MARAIRRVFPARDAANRSGDRGPRYRQVGDLLGQANCIISLGDIALRRSDLDAARSKFDEALVIYRRLGAPYSIGHALMSLARVARDAGEQATLLREAREAWSPLGLPHLLRALDDLEAPG